MSTGDDILASSMEAKFASILRHSAVSLQRLDEASQMLARSGVVLSGGAAPATGFAEATVAYDTTQLSQEQRAELEQHSTALCNELEAMTARN